MCQKVSTIAEALSELFHTVSCQKWLDAQVRIRFYCEMASSSKVPSSQTGQVGLVAFSAHLPDVHRQVIHQLPVNFCLLELHQILQFAT